MGAWVPGLYEDDEAADLRDSIKALVKLHSSAIMRRPERLRQKPPD